MPPKSSEQFIKQLEAHPAYQQNSKVKELVDGYSDMIKGSQGMTEQHINLLLAGLQMSLRDLLTNEEDFEIDELAPGMNLEQQYHRQRVLGVRLNQMGLLNNELCTEHITPVLDYNGQKYPMPSWEEVKKIIFKNRETFSQKAAQGFTQLAIVPFGLPLESLTGAFGRVLHKLNSEEGVYSGREQFSKGSGEKINFNPGDHSPLAAHDPWFEPDYEYKRSGNIGSKSNIVEAEGPWQICLLEDRPMYEWGPSRPPIKGNPGDSITARKTFDTHSLVTPLQMIAEICDQRHESPEIYHNESGILPETYLWMQLLSLLANSKPVLIDYIAADKNLETIFPDCLHKNLPNMILTAGWSSEDGRFELSTTTLDSLLNHCGLRTCVPLK